MFSDSNCITKGGADSNSPCIFPFRWNETIHENCIWDRNAAWCSTMVDNKGQHVAGKEKWGYCGQNCPIATRSG